MPDAESDRRAEYALVVEALRAVLDAVRADKDDREFYVNIAEGAVARIEERVR